MHSVDKRRTAEEAGGTEGRKSGSSRAKKQHQIRVCTYKKMGCCFW